MPRPTRVRKISAGLGMGLFILSLPNSSLPNAVRVPDVPPLPPDTHHCSFLFIHSLRFSPPNPQATAHLITSESVEIQVTLWHGTAPQHPDCVVVEAQRRRGDAVCFHKYCRHLLDAASGTFDPATFRRCEEREAVLYQKSEELLSRGAKGGAAGKGEAAAAPKVAGADHESALLALEIAASLLKKDRMDARQLGMESLCLLTDPTRSGIETALIASRVVLTGSPRDDDDVDGGEGFDGDDWGIREAILSLVQFGRLGEDGGIGQDFDSDSDEEGGTGSDNPDEKRHNDRLHNLALAVLANSLDVLEQHSRRLAGSESPSSVADAFLSDSREMMDRDLLSTLLAKLGNASHKPHDACLSAQCLRSLCEASKEARRRARELKAKQIVQTALDVGRRTHVKLETKTERLITTLTKAEGDEAQQQG